MIPKQEDCYFFYNSMCTKGDRCRFRHCEAAKRSKTVCKFWLENCCLNKACRFRHVNLKKRCREIKRPGENQPGVYQKQDSPTSQRPRIIRRVVLQDKGQLPNVQEEASSASLKKPPHTRTASPASEALTLPPSDMKPGQNRKRSWSVCSATAGKHQSEEVKEIQSGSSSEEESKVKPQKTHICIIRRHLFPQAKGQLSQAQEEASGDSLGKPHSTKTESPASEALNKNSSLSDVKPGQRRERSGSVDSADAEQPHCEGVKKEENVPQKPENEPEKPQSYSGCTVLPAKDDEIEFFIKGLEELKLEDSAKTHLETAVSPASEDSHQLQSAVKTPSQAQLARKRKAAWSIFANEEASCKRAKVILLRLTPKGCPASEVLAQSPAVIKTPRKAAWNTKCCTTLQVC